MKKNSGITLIALVITIIVLLILAGVALAMISGNGGILGKASDAKVQNAIAETKDQIALDVAEAVADYYDEAYVSNNNTVQNQDIDAYIFTKIDAKKAGYSQAGVFTTALTDQTTKVRIVINPTDSTLFGYTGEIQDGKITWTKATVNPAS